MAVLCLPDMIFIRESPSQFRLPTRVFLDAALKVRRLTSRAEDTIVAAKGKALVSTDLSIACPAGTYGRVAPRSGLGPIHSESRKKADV